MDIFKSMKNTVLYIFLCFSLYSISQKTYQIRGRITDARTYQPVYYAHIFLKSGKYAGICDENGYFDISFKTEKNDTLLVSAVGYIAYALPVDALPVDNLSNKPPAGLDIQLQNKTYLLNPVIIKEMKSQKKTWKTIELGVTQKPEPEKKIYGISSTSIPFLRGRKGRQEHFSTSLWIKNEYDFMGFIPTKRRYVGFIKSVSIFITKYGNPESPVRLHIFEADTLTGRPGRELTYKKIIMKGDTGNQWVKAELTKYHIPVPPNGFHIVVEWLQDSGYYLSEEEKFFYKKLIPIRTDSLIREEWHNKDSIRFTKNRIHISDTSIINAINSEIAAALYNGPRLGYIHTKRKDAHLLNWNYSGDNTWFFHKGKQENSDVLWVENLNCFKAEIIYYKTEKRTGETACPIKIKDQYIIPSEKQLLSLFDTIPPVDTMKYPQNSLAKFLHSLKILAEEGNFIYIFSSMGVFENEEIMTMIFERLQQKKSTNSLLTANEKKTMQNEIRNIVKVYKKYDVQEPLTNYFELPVKNYAYTFVKKNGVWKVNLVTARPDNKYFPETKMPK